MLCQKVRYCTKLEKRPRGVQRNSAAKRRATNEPRFGPGAPPANQVADAVGVEMQSVVDCTKNRRAAAVTNTTTRLDAASSHRPVARVRIDCRDQPISSVSELPTATVTMHATT